MKGITTILQFISEEYMLILAIGFIIFGIYLKVKRFMNQSAEVKKQQLRDEVTNVTTYIKACLKELVTAAEQKYGSGTGEIKRADVYRELLKLIPSLEDYIIDGDITTAVIGNLIDEAVDYMNGLAKSNDDVASTFSKPMLTGTAFIEDPELPAE